MKQKTLVEFKGEILQQDLEFLFLAEKYFKLVRFNRIINLLTMSMIIGIIIMLIIIITVPAKADGLAWEREPLGFPDDRSLITGELLEDDELDPSDFILMQQQREMYLDEEEASSPITYEEYLMYKDLFPEIYKQKILDKNSRG